MRESRSAIIHAVNESLRMQERQNNAFRNAFSLETYLKNPNVPLWVEMAPANYLKNMTGFGDEELLEAMNILFQNNKISQRTEKETITLPVPQGIMTREIEKIYVASTERLEAEAETTSASQAVTLATVIVILAVGLILFWQFGLRKRTVL